MRKDGLDNEDIPYICYEHVVVIIVKSEAKEKLQGLQLLALQMSKGQSVL